MYIHTCIHACVCVFVRILSILHALIFSMSWMGSWKLVEEALSVFFHVICIMVENGKVKCIEGDRNF